MNSDRSKCIMAGLGRYELTLLEKRFVGRVKEYCEKNGMVTERQESILGGIYREKIRWMKRTARGEEADTGRDSVNGEIGWRVLNLSPVVENFFIEKRLEGKV